MNQNHTYGPWYPVEYAGYWIIQDGDKYGDRDVLNIESDPLAKANAKLAAAAPELLKALHSMTLSMSAHPDCNEGSEFQDMVNIANEAIKKAIE